MTSFETLDWVVLSLYFIALLGIAIWVIRQKNENTEDYFLAGKNVGWFVIGASTCLDCFIAGLVISTFLYAERSVYDAGVFGKTF